MPRRLRKKVHALTSATTRSATTAVGEHADFDDGVAGAFRVDKGRAVTKIWRMFTPIRPAPLHRMIVRQLLHAIFSGQLHGGTHLVEKKLTAQFQVSSTPVREALLELAALGLVEIRPNRGAIVLPFNPDNLRGIYHVRMALECEAVRLAIKRLPASEIEANEKACEELLAPGPRSYSWSMRVKAVDLQLHEMIATWAGVTRLAIEICRYCQLVESIDLFFSENQGFQPQEQEKSIRQHLTILSALKEGNADLAVQAMHEHLHFAVEGGIAGFFTKEAS